jgi:hypothetical protein
MQSRSAEKKDGAFTVTCEATETIKIGKKSYECVKFRLHLKSADVRTDLWVAKSGVVVRFLDILPEGAEASFLEASLQE